jgi:hypothetical protein
MHMLPKATICIFIYVYTYVYIYICIYIYIHVSIYTNMHTPVCKCITIYAFMNIIQIGKNNLNFYEPLPPSLLPPL